MFLDLNDTKRIYREIKLLSIYNFIRIFKAQKYNKINRYY